MSSADTRPPALVHAETATESWREAVRRQRRAAPDHADFYALAGEIVTTLHALDDLTALLGEQVAGYPQGRALYDDTHTVDPLARLDDAAAEIGAAGRAIVTAAESANRFWSAIGHIGVAS